MARAIDRVATLRKRLVEGSTDLQIKAAEALGYIGPKSVDVLSELCHALANGEPRLRVVCARALGQIGSPAALPRLLAAAADPEPEVRAEIMRAVGTLDRPDETTGVSREAVLRSALGDEDRRVRQNARWAMVSITRRRVAALLRELQESGGPERVGAAWALGKMGSQAGPAVPGLVRALKDPTDAQLRAVAAEALGRIGFAAGAAAADLAEALGDEEEDVRRLAADALGRVGPGAHIARPALARTAMEDRDESVRNTAMESLRLIDAGG